MQRGIWIGEEAGKNIDGRDGQMEKGSLDVEGKGVGGDEWGNESTESREKAEETENTGIM